MRAQCCDPANISLEDYQCHRCCLQGCGARLSSTSGDKGYTYRDTYTSHLPFSRGIAVQWRGLLTGYLIGHSRSLPQLQSRPSTYLSQILYFWHKMTDISDEHAEVDPTRFDVSEDYAKISSERFRELGNALSTVPNGTGWARSLKRHLPTQQLWKEFL